MAEESPQAIDKEFADVLSFYTSYVFPLYDKYWKAYLKDDSDRLALLEEWRASVYVSLTQKTIDVMNASLYDAQIGYGVVGTNTIGIENARNVRACLDWWFELCNGKETLMEMAFDAFVVGKCYDRTEWQKKEETVTRTTAKGTKTYTLSSSSAPGMRSVSPYCLLLDPMAKSLESARYLYELRWMTCEQAWETYRLLLGDEITESDFKAKVESTKKPQKPGEKKEISQVAENGDLIKQKIMMVKASMAAYEQGKTQLNASGGVTTSPLAQTTGTIKIEYDEKVHCFAERWTNNSLKIYCDGVCIYSPEFPMPMDCKPYSEAYYKKLPRTIFGVGVAGTISDIQYMANLLNNLKLDSAKFYGVPAFTRKRGLPGQMYGGDEKLVISPGAVISVSEDNEIKPLMGANYAGNIDILRQEALDLSNEANASSGINEYVLGIQGKVERSAVAVKTLVNSFKTRLAPFVSSLNHAMARVAKQWMAMAIAIGDEELFIPLVGAEKGGQLLELSIEDITGQYTFSFEVNGLAQITEETDKDILKEVLPILMKMMYNPVTNEPIGDMAVLLKYVLEKFKLPSEAIFPEAADDAPTDDTAALISELQSSLAPPQNASPQMVPQATAAAMPALPAAGQ